MVLQDLLVRLLPEIPTTVFALPLLHTKLSADLHVVLVLVFALAVVQQDVLVV
jgi:hypothetical protein